MIPLRDIPVLKYNVESRMTATPGTTPTFEYALEKNLTKLIHFCSQLKLFQQKQSIEHQINERKLPYRHYHRHIASQESKSQSSHE
jgi:hypothetical protein